MPSQLLADIAIVGGGPSGMAAAIAAAQRSPNKCKIVLLERGPRVGKKLLSTGNGRCNLTNATIPADSRYHGQDPSFLHRVLRHYSSDSTLSFFGKLGLLCREEEDGRIYPCSGQASSVLDVLRRGMEEFHVEQICECALQDIHPDADGFTLSCGSITVRARNVILATGGKAAPSTGSDGSGFTLAKSLGHSVTPLFPALAPIRTDPQRTRPMKGMRSTGSVTLRKDGQPFRTENGEIQFSDGALSGICVFQLSRFAGEYLSCHTIDGSPCRDACLSLDLLPEFSTGQLVTMLTKLVNSCPGVPLEHYLTGMVNKRVGQALLKSLNFGALSTPCGDLSERAIRQIGSTIKDWRFPILATSAWNQAQVTAGGLSLREFSPDNLESRLIPGLYAAGELLDADGDCGGFNLQWAWSTGRIAGQSAADRLIHERRNPL